MPKGHTLTEQDREVIIAARGDGATTAEIIRVSGFSANTIALVLAGAREEGDMRAHPDPEVRRRAMKQRVAAGAAHREGGDNSLAHATALPPNRVEASLIARGMRPEVARITAKVWADRHGRNDAGPRR